MIFIQSPRTNIQSHLILFSLLFCIQSHIPCWRRCFRKYCHAAGIEIIELRKRQIQKYKNAEDRILNSNKNIIEKTETWKTLEELRSLQEFYMLYQ